jgi:DNA-binding transcriptional LysR family regulator
MDDWRGIKEFLAVVEEGSFSAAADKLDKSTPQVSRRIRQLEEKLGVRLLTRTTRSVLLTDLGRIFFERCQKVQEDMAEAAAIVTEGQRNPVGHLRISVAGILGEDYVAPVLSRFMVEYPGISMELEFSNRLVDLVEEQYDLAIRVGALPNRKSMIVKKIASYRLLTCASPDYLKEAPPLEAPLDLKTHSCLVGTLPFWRFKNSNNNDVSELSVSGRWRSNNGHALVNAALAGLGISQLPEMYVNELVTSGRLVTILDDWEAPPLPVWAVYADRTYLPVKVSSLIGYLSRNLNIRGSRK